MPEQQTVTHTVDMTGVSVMLAMPINRDLPWQTAFSLLETQVACISNHIPIGIQRMIGGDTVVTARSRLAHEFLKSSYSHLFFVDSDMAWRPEDFIRLVHLGTKMECVGVAYTAKCDPPKIMCRPGKAWVHGGAEISTNEYGCFPFEGLGLGFTIIRRTILEQLAAKAPKALFPDQTEPTPIIFHTDIDEGGEWRGEDIRFFADVADLGYQVWTDPTIKLGHIGDKEYEARLLDLMTINKELGK